MNLDLKEQRLSARLRIASVALQWYETDLAVRQAERAEDRVRHQQAVEEERNWRDNLRYTIESFAIEGVL